MPRRPRPAPREKPDKGKFVANVASSSRVKLPLPRAAPERRLKAVDTESESDEDGDESSPVSDEEASEEGDSSDGSTGENLDEDGEESDMDVDAPRVSQWVDDEDLEELEAPAGDASHGDAEDIETVQDNLASLPLGALRRAQRALARAEAEENPSDSEEDERSESGSEPEEVSAKGKETKPNAHKPEWSNKPRTDIAKRGNKNAPTEVTSKKPVTRRRQIVEVAKTEVRDPRFLPFAGKLQPQLYRQSYGFLADMHKTELSTLKENLKRARKMLASSPRDQREEREQEIAKLEQAVKRAESNVNKDKREQVEQDALQKVKQEEKEKRKAGKGAWHMKDTERRKLLVKARYDALAAEGGKRAVRKAIEKKQKKIGQKEKKSRPFNSKPPPSRKRSLERDSRDGGGERKRIRT